MLLFMRLHLFVGLILLLSILSCDEKHGKYKKNNIEIKLDKNKILKIFETDEHYRSLFKDEMCFISSYSIINNNCVSPIRLSCPSILSFELLEIENYFFEFSIDKNKILTETFIMDISNKNSIQDAINRSTEDLTDEKNFDDIQIVHNSISTKYMQKRGVKYEGKKTLIEDNELTVFDTGHAHYVHKGLSPSQNSEAFELCRKMYYESVLP